MDVINIIVNWKTFQLLCRLVVNGAMHNAQCATFPHFKFITYLDVRASLFTFGIILIYSATVDVWVQGNAVAGGGETCAEQ